MIDKIADIVSIALVVVNLAIVITTFIISKIKKSKNITEETKSNIETTESIVELVKTIIPQAIEVAENSGILNSQAKKIVALSKIMLECSDMGIDYQANADLIDDTLENLIDFSKKVNVADSEEETK